MSSFCVREASFDCRQSGTYQCYLACYFTSVFFFCRVWYSKVLLGCVHFLQYSYSWCPIAQTWGQDLSRMSFLNSPIDQFPSYFCASCNDMMKTESCHHDHFLTTGGTRDVTMTYLTHEDEMWGDQCHFVYMPSQWEMMLQCNVVSHWLVANTKWSLGDYYEFTVLTDII